MNGKDKIKDLFAEKLGGHEAPVNPELWNAIASQIGTAATVTSTGLSIVAKTIIGVSAASVIGVGAYFFITQDDHSAQQDSQEIQHQQLVVKEDTIKEEQNDSDKVEAHTIYSPPAVADEVIKIQIESCGENPPTPNPVINPAHLESLAKKEKTSSGNPESKPLTNESTSNVIGERPAPAPIGENKTQVNEEKNEPKIITDTEVNPPRKQEAKPSFELTNLPNIYVLNANGYFSIGYKGEYNDFQFTIMDKRNNVIFRSDRPDFEWRGTDLYGNQIEPGNYIYIITAKDHNGLAVNKYSNLTVINQ